MPKKGSLDYGVAAEAFERGAGNMHTEHIMAFRG
jgi:hypothetical protein